MPWPRSPQSSLSGSRHGNEYRTRSTPPSVRRSPWRYHASISALADAPARAMMRIGGLSTISESGKRRVTSRNGKAGVDPSKKTRQAKQMAWQKKARPIAIEVRGKQPDWSRSDQVRAVGKGPIVWSVHCRELAVTFFSFGNVTASPAGRAVGRSRRAGRNRGRRSESRRSRRCAGSSLSSRARGRACPEARACRRR
jgi:hypothetical protein